MSEERKLISERSSYLATALSLYVNFFVHGVGVIAIAQNMGYLMIRYGTDEAGIANVISGMGAGRFVSYFFTGFLSDKFGRKPMVLLGIFIYILFFLGIAFSVNIWMAFAFSVLGGVANACLDTGTYPALMEAYPKTSGSAIIFCKAAVSFGQMFYPIFVGFLLIHQIWFGYGFLIPATILLLSAILISRKKFPRMKKGEMQEAEEKLLCLPTLRHKPHFYFDGILVILYGFAVYMTFHTALIWLPKYSSVVAGMSEVTSLKTITYYSIGSLISVFLLGWLVSKLLRPVVVLVISPLLATLAILIIYWFPSPLVCNVGSFIIGASVAGGVLQLGLSVLSEFFPNSKAKVTSFYMLLGSFANFIVPLITGMLFRLDIRYVLLFAGAAGTAACFLGFIIFLRYYWMFEIPSMDYRAGEKFFIRKALSHQQTRNI